MSALRMIGPVDLPPPPPPVPTRGRRPSSTQRWLFWVASGSAVIVTFAVFWWSSNADRREIQALPDEQRLPLYHRTMDNLRNICDPAATRSLRDYCHNEADLVLRFRECDSDPLCQELARRHLPQPRR